LFGYRLSGTITIPVLAVYTLTNVVTLPVFVLSTIIASLGLELLKRRTLLYGRDELLAAIIIGSVIPIGLLIVLKSSLGDPLRAVLFLGSILPGLAAFNYHQLKPQYRKWDLITSVALFVGLVAIGYLLVAPDFRSLLGVHTPPILFSEAADVARWRGAAVADPGELILIDRPSTVGVLGLAMVATEALRRRYAIRIGVIAVGLLAIYALASVWLLAVYLALFAVTYAVLQEVHRSTILYGRVLIGLSTAFSLIVALPFVIQLPITHGLSAYFVAIFAGVNAYNMHATAPAYRVLIPPLQFATFLTLLGITRAFVDPLSAGLPQQFGPSQIVVGAVVVVVCVGFAEYYTVSPPSEEAVYDSSIISGGGEA
jgi:hypothetical protein